MTSTETETAPPTAAPPEPATSETAPPVDGSCPRCGSHVVFTVTLDYDVAGGFRLDHFGVQPATGDTAARCDRCGTFWIVPGAATEKDEPAPTIAFGNQPAGSPTPPPAAPDGSPAPAPVPDPPPPAS